MRSALCLPLLLCACKPPLEAPSELSPLARYIFREHANPDPEVVQLGVSNLDALLDTVDLSADDVADRSFQLDPLQVGDMGELERPDRALDATLSLAVTWYSPWPIEDHVPYMVLTDLTEISTTASTYDRDFLEGSADCFSEGSCDSVHTHNDIVRDSAFLKMAYWNFKDFRRVDTNGELAAVVARTWQPEAAHGDSDRNHVWQNFESEAWIRDADGTRRFYGVWTEAEYAGVSEDIGYSLTRSAAQDALDKLDDWIEAQQP